MTAPTSTPESNPLLTLGEITQLVVHSSDAANTLNNIVQLTQKLFKTAVCSVYCLEPTTQELVLSATVGLKPEAVGRIRMRLHEGLTGLVAEQLAPVMVPDAFEHPRFKYFPEAGEDRFHSFLGVPLLQGGTLHGVLVVQTVEKRHFSPAEIRTLVCVAAQLAPVVADARLIAQVGELAHEPILASTSSLMAGSLLLQGTPLSPGIGLGEAYVVDGFDEWRQTVPLRANDVQIERQRLAGAMFAAHNELTRLSQHISELVGENHGAILQAQLMIMQDRTIERDLESCLAGGASAEGALFATLDRYVAAFQRISQPLFRERVFDIKDVFHRLLWQLRPRRDAEREGLRRPNKVVLIARESSVMELFAVDIDQLAGVVVEHGGPQSHAAILARSLGIPMVGQIQDFNRLKRPGQLVLVDGQQGQVILDPPADTVVPGKQTTEVRLYSCGVELPPGLPRVEVNVNLLHEARSAIQLGASGVGLYRSEFLFLARRTLPTEDEQVTVYRKLLHVMQGRPVCIRTFDLRPDKLDSYSELGASKSRPYDWRCVLESPPLQQLFREQVRAILRAANEGSVRLLVPLVTRTEILDFIRATLAQARDSLNREGLPHVDSVPLGLMIETAAAVPLVADWIEQVDFLALGTNDLTASALGLDRDDPVVAAQVDGLHPGLLRLIHQVIDTAHRADRTVSVCGEVAADPLGALALALLKVDALSVPVPQFTTIRDTLMRVGTTINRTELATQMLQQRTASQVRALLREVLESAGQPPCVERKEA